MRLRTRLPSPSCAVHGELTASATFYSLFAQALQAARTFIVRKKIPPALVSALLLSHGALAVGGVWVLETEKGVVRK